MSGAWDYDVIVVGSGYGGSSAAEALARAGLKVGILERGTWWGAFGGHRALPETLPQIIAALRGLNFSGFGRYLSIPLSRRGVLEVSLHGGTIVLNSAGVGGNSLVSGGYLQRPAPQFYDALPPELTQAGLAPHYERIERALEVSPGPQDQRRLTRLTTLASQHGWTIGAPPQAIRWTSDEPQSRPVCTQCNRCTFGCNVGAKQSFDQNLIPSAMRAGAAVRDLCTVQAIQRVKDGYEVRVHDGRAQRAIVVRAPRVVVAAGGLNTLKILLRSTAAGALGTMPLLGRHFSMGADTVAFYRLPRVRPVKEVAGHLVDVQIQVPAAGGRFDQLILAATGPFFPGSWLLRRLQRDTLPLFGFGPDAMDGEVTWCRRGIVVRHEPQALVARIQTSLDRIAQALGGRRPVRPLDAGRRVRPWLSMHPIGGCRMATDASRGVVDYRGEVFGHSGLYVADAAVLPTMTIAGPQLSVAALGSWIAERIVTEAR